MEPQATQPSAQASARGWRALRTDWISGLALVAFALFLAWENREYPVGTLANPGPGFMPLALAIFLGATGLLIVLWGGRSQRLGAMRWREAPHGVLVLALCAAAVLVLEWAGYRLTMTLLLAVLLGVVERRPPLTVAIVSLGFALLSAYVVGDLLLVPLPRGPWGF
jgi:peptidoglycan biosynthesis protein MviN/MurJ (putative lipid II flippase)